MSNAALRSKLPYDPLKDFVPVTGIGSQLASLTRPAASSTPGYSPARSAAWSSESTR